MTTLWSKDAELSENFVPGCARNPVWNFLDPYVDPEYKLYMSSVVMRIPGYNGDMEEPWYWENFGRDIYEFSYYTDKDEAQWIRNVADMN